MAPSALTAVEEKDIRYHIIQSHAAREINTETRGTVWYTIHTSMILKGEKTILRLIRITDAERFVAWLADPQVRKLLGGRKITLREERAWIRSLRNKKTEIQFAIDTRYGVHIGSLGFRLEPRHKNALFGILVGDRTYWNKGYGTDAMRVALDYGFKRLRLHRIELMVYAYNPRATHVYEKLGFKHEGVLRERVLHNGKYYNEFAMGLLRKEWSKKR